jgi:hypothetical protein
LARIQCEFEECGDRGARAEVPARAHIRGGVCRGAGDRVPATFTVGVATLSPLVALIAGILILVMPRLLNYIVAIYLIISGLLGFGLFGR